jgi:hypothetical protein
VTVQSSAGHGSRFTVVLPTDPPPAPAEDPGGDVTANRSHPAPAALTAVS